MDNSPSKHLCDNLFEFHQIYTDGHKLDDGHRWPNCYFTLRHCSTAVTDLWFDNHRRQEKAILCLFCWRSDGKIWKMLCKQIKWTVLQYSWKIYLLTLVALIKNELYNLIIYFLMIHFIKYYFSFIIFHYDWCFKHLLSKSIYNLSICNWFFLI